MAINTKCCSNTKIIGFALLPNYNHIMSDKIRKHLIEKSHREIHKYIVR